MGERGVQVSRVLLKGASVFGPRLSQYPPMSFAVESASQFLVAKASQSRFTVLGPLRLNLDSRPELRVSWVDADGSAQARVDADRSALAAETETLHKRHLGVSLYVLGSLSGSREETTSQHKGLIKLAGENASQSAEGDVGRHK